jgi:hypothetical protein
MTKCNVATTKDKTNGGDKCLEAYKLGLLNVRSQFILHNSGIYPMMLHNTIFDITGNNMGRVLISSIALKSIEILI